MNAVREVIIFDQVGKLDEAEQAVGFAAWVLRELAAESVPAAEIDALRDEADEAAWELFAALDALEEVADITDVDAIEAAADLLRDLADRRASRQELSRLRQDGRDLAGDLQDVADAIEGERDALLSDLDDDDDDAT